MRNTEREGVGVTGRLFHIVSSKIVLYLRGNKTVNMNLRKGVCVCVCVCVYRKRIRGGTSANIYTNIEFIKK